jgi:nicotinate-nucleotide pyrophosphorylase (carboxylating)
MRDTVKQLIEMALAEDIGLGDITTDYLIPDYQKGRGVIVAKEELVLAGIGVTKDVYTAIDAGLEFETTLSDGDAVKAGDEVLRVSGQLASILKGERTALNFLQRLSGIATNVNRFVKEMGDTPVRLVDTRKTTPGWRVLEKYAVRIGGAANHRMGLYDGILIKDNHITACGTITAAVKRARRHVSHLVKIEVEVGSIQEVEEAVAAGADVIMLDNMDLAQIREAVELINGKALVEVSGGVKKTDLKQLAETGVDLISVGALTHSAVAVDLSMRIY